VIDVGVEITIIPKTLVVDGTSIENVAGVIGVMNNGITTAKILNANVTQPKLPTGTSLLKYLGSTTLGAPASSITVSGFTATVASYAKFIIILKSLSRVSAPANS
jgi:hypothetical protein